MASDDGPTLVILAAGMGSRFGGLKQLEPLGPEGNVLIEYSVFDAVRAGFSRVVFIIRQSFADEFAAMVAELGNHIAIEYAFQDAYQAPGLPDREKPWGTGHALLSARDLLDDSFAIVNADDYYGRSSYATAADYLASVDANGTRHAMLGYVMRGTLSAHGTVSRGLCHAGDDGLLQSVVEHHKVHEANGSILAEDGDGNAVELPSTALASMNYWIFTPTIFNLVQRELGEFAAQFANDEKAEFLLPDIVGRLITSGDVTVDCLRHEDTWFGMTHREDREHAVAVVAGMHENNFYPTPLWGEDRSDH